MFKLRHLALALAMAGLVSTAACSRVMQGYNEPSAQVVFVNQSLSQADVYTVTDAGVAQRIGTVFAGRTDTLDIPSTLVGRAGTVRIVAQLLASSAGPRTGPLTFTDGEMLRVTLPAAGRMLTVLPAG